MSADRSTQYFNVTMNPDDADFALVFMDTPTSMGYAADYFTESRQTNGCERV